MLLATEDKNNNNSTPNPTRRKKKRRAADQGVKKFQGMSLEIITIVEHSFGSHSFGSPLDLS